MSHGVVSFDEENWGFELNDGRGQGAEGMTPCQWDTGPFSGFIADGCQEVNNKTASDKPSMMYPSCAPGLKPRGITTAVVCALCIYGEQWFGRRYAEQEQTRSGLLRANDILL